MDNLLRSAFTNEGLRRMTRKAGVSSTREKDLVVNDELRVVAEIILRNICDKLAILAEYHDRTTVSEAILREALRSLEVRMDSSMSKPTALIAYISRSCRSRACFGPLCRMAHTLS